MKILSFEAENIKRLKVVSITPTGNMVEITGKNAQGKTSVLDAIYLALKVSDLDQSKPIREGEEKGFVRLKLGEKEVELVVTRKFKAGADGYTTSIAVESPEGAKFPSPQAVLDKLFSTLTFDPLEFSRMDPGKQVQAVKALLPGVDFEGTAKQNKADFDKRTDVNREHRAAEARANGGPVGQAPPLIDEDGLLAELTACSEFNAGIETRKANRVKAAEDIAAHEKIIEDAQAFIKDLKERLDAAPPLPALKDAQQLADALKKAKDSNAYAATFAARDKHRDEAAELKATSDKLTAAIEARSKALQDAIQAAKFPVDGLTFSDEAILLNGLPLNQASDAEQLRTSVAIAMALNPKLKVIRVRDGSLLDEDGLKLLAQMADEKDYQVWIERVDSSGKVGFVLEDGHLKGQDIAPVETVKVVETAVPAVEVAVIAEAPKPAPAPKKKPTQADLL